MSKKYRMLAVGGGAGIDLAVSKYMKEADIKPVILPLDTAAVTAELDSEKCDGILIFSVKARKTIELIGLISRKYPDICIFVGVYSFHGNEEDDYIQAGADLCFYLPTSMRRIVRIVKSYAIFSKNSNIETSIPCFLWDKGLCSDTKGFLYLCKAIELCLSDSSCLSHMYEKVYGGVAEEFNVSMKSVERLVRLTVVNAVENGQASRIFKRNVEKMTVRSFIKEMCYLYCRKYVAPNTDINNFRI